jgi:methylmalonyl-CoA mutase
VNTVIQEDANAIALTSYQEVIWSILNTCMICLQKKERAHKIFGGGVILPYEIEELKLMELLVFTPDDGRSMGLQGMINDLVERSDYPVGDKLTDEAEQLASKNPTAIARITAEVSRNSETQAGGYLHK